MRRKISPSEQRSSADANKPKAGTFSAFRVTNCEFSELLGGRGTTSHPISLAKCNERRIRCTKRESLHS